MSRRAKKNRPPEARDLRRQEKTIFAPAVCAALVLAVFLVFGRTAYFDFVNLDDDQYITGEPQVMGGLTAHGIAWAFTHGHVGNWHPLTSISLMFDWQLFGRNAGGYHVHNVLLHAAAAMLLFLALRRMTGALWPSAVVAAIFAVHPLRVESVAWVTERKDVLSGVFLMLTLWAYAVYATRPFSLLRYSAVLVFFAMGLMSKSILVTTPLVLLLLDYWPLGRMVAGTLRVPSACWGGSCTATPGTTVQLSPQRIQKQTTHGQQTAHGVCLLLWEKVPLLLLSAAFSVTTVISTGDPVRPIDILPLPVRIANALVAYVSYLGQIFYPFGLAPHYPYSEGGPPAWRVVVACCVLLLISTAAFLARRRHPYLLVGWLWYLITLLPVIGLVPGGIQFLADRYTYITQIGLYVALVWAFVDLTSSWPRRAWVCGVVSAIVISGLTVRAWSQTAHWRNSETLWKHTLACTAENAFAHGNLGSFLQDSGRIGEAVEHYRQALRIAPDSLSAPNNLAGILLDQGKTNEAIALYQWVIQVNPKFAEPYYNLGNARLSQGKIDEAIACYEKVLELDPNHVFTCNNLANVLANKGKLDQAVAYYRKALAISPNYVAAHYNLGNVMNLLGRLDEAIAHFQKALELKPDYVDARKNLVVVLNDVSWMLATAPEASLRDGAKAVRLARRAVELSGGRNPTILGTLAAAYAEAGRFPQAVETARKALELATRQDKKRLADALRQRLKLYQAGVPFRNWPAQ